MTKTVLFESLQGVLEGLGSQTQAVPGSHVAFKHAGSGALVVLRYYQADEGVSPTDLAIARRVLEEFGVLDRQAFDEALRERAVAGPPGFTGPAT